MTLHEFWTEAAARLRRWREDRTTLAALDQLDVRSRAELEMLVRRRRDEAEFDSKGRSVDSPAPIHIARGARRAHS